MTRQRHIGPPAARILALSMTSARGSPPDEKQQPQARTTMKSNGLCNRATDTKPWFWDPKDGDHTPIIYALERTRGIGKGFRKIIESDPD